MEQHAEESKPWGLREEPLSLEHKEILKPGQVALLVVDLQKGYADKNEVLARVITRSTTYDLDQMAGKIPDFIEQARKAGIPVIWIRMAENPDDMSPNYQRKMRLEDTPPITVPGERSFEYIGEGLDESDPRSKLKPQPGEKEVIKKTYNAFKKTDLDDYLQSQGIATVVVIGAYASRCVAATAGDAADSGYNVFVPRDLTANLDADRFEKDPHLNKISTIYGYLPYANQITEVWESST